MAYASKVRQIPHDEGGKGESLDKVKWDRKHDLCGGVTLWSGEVRFLREGQLCCL